MSRRALIIDDEESICWSLSRALKADGYEAEIASTAEAGLQAVRDRRPDVVFLDVRLPGMDGLTALGKLHESSNELPVIVMTAYGDLATAISAIQNGAFDYLVKPFDLSHALRLAALAEQATHAPRSNAGAVWTEDDLIGRSEVMQQVFKKIAMVAGSSACVLITGESGTGKELVARALHRHGQRSTGPFLPVHAAALNAGLVESELFGHVRGAFTGATETRTGLLALADGGTVFLDEVAEIPLNVQVKLLRALEMGEVLPVGADRPVRHDFRIIAATNRDLQQLVEEGRFRQDLLFRLNVFRIHLPPLRDRLDDIPLLAAYFLSQLAPHHPAIADATLEYLQKQSWPGNVRELRNALERAAVMARGSAIMPEHLHESSPASNGTDGALEAAVQQWLRQRLPSDSPTTNLSADLIQAAERALLQEVIRRTDGNRTLAAEWLGLDRATVRKKLQQYGLDTATEASAK